MKRIATRGRQIAKLFISNFSPRDRGGNCLAIADVSIGALLQLTIHAVDDYEGLTNCISFGGHVRNSGNSIVQNKGGGVEKGNFS